MPSQPPRRRTSRLQPLKPEELAVVQLLARGKTPRETMQALDCAAHTLKANTRRLCAKLDVATRSQALQRARELGRLEEPIQEAPVPPP